MEASLEDLLAKVRVIAETPRADLLRQIVDLLYEKIESHFDDEPLTQEDREAIARGREDIEQGRFITLEEYRSGKRL